MDIQHGDGHGQAANFAIAGKLGLALMQHRHIKTGATHVGRDQVGIFVGASDRHAGHHSAGGT